MSTLRKAEQGTLYEMIHIITQTGDLPSHGGFFICDSHFDEMF